MSKNKNVIYLHVYMHKMGVLHLRQLLKNAIFHLRHKVIFHLHQKIKKIICAILLKMFKMYFWMELLNIAQSIFSKCIQCMDVKMEIMCTCYIVICTATGKKWSMPPTDVVFIISALWTEKPYTNSTFYSYKFWTGYALCDACVARNEEWLL